MKTWIPLLDPLGGLIVLEKPWNQTPLPSKSNELMRDNFYRILHYLHVPKIPQYVLFGIFLLLRMNIASSTGEKLIGKNLRSVCGINQ